MSLVALSLTLHLLLQQGEDDAAQVAHVVALDVVRCLIPWLARSVAPVAHTRTKGAPPETAVPTSAPIATPTLVATASSIPTPQPTVTPIPVPTPLPRTLEDAIEGLPDVWSGGVKPEGVGQYAGPQRKRLA